MTTTHVLAIDLGAESGRVMHARLAEDRVTLDELHRFPTGGIRLGDTLRWDLLRIADEIRQGLRAAKNAGIQAEAISADSWAVDYVLMRRDEAMLGLPFHYRDDRTSRSYAAVLSLLGKPTIFAETGIQFLPFNTIYQLASERAERPWALDAAEGFLHIADWVNWMLSGVAAVDESIASHSQLYNPTTRTWSDTLLRRLDLPGRLFPAVVPCGSVLGPILPAIAADLGHAGAKIVASASHDTGAAVAAVPGQGDDWAYLSSGTWSLLGVELKQPVLSAEALAHNYTNELGLGGSVRFLKNIVGLWIVQECRRFWQATGSDLSYDEITRLASAAPGLVSLINPADMRFAAPGDMPTKIQAFCRETGQPVPESQGAILRCVFDSLALSYRRGIEAIESITGRHINRLHIVGGGAKNALLNRLAADASGRTVYAGPIECTAVGNALIQCLALGRLRDHDHLRQVVRNSFPVEEIRPGGDHAWQAAWERFRRLP